MEKIKIAHLYYDLMNLYGENGNIRFLKRKLEDQKVEVEVHFLSINDKIDFDKYDFYYIGTGSNENKDLVLNNLMEYKKEINEAILNNKFFLVTGNALELFGKNITDKEEKVTETLGVFGYDVREEEFRIVGEQYYSCDFIDHNIIGFQNRESVISDSGDSLFKVIKGTGYNPGINFEGVHSNNFYGTYLLGPILVRNPYFTDYLIQELCKVKKIKYIKPDENDVSYKAYYEYLKNFYENN